MVFYFDAKFEEQKNSPPGTQAGVMSNRDIYIVLNFFFYID
jgi:hypothetical protein